MAIIPSVKVSHMKASLDFWAQRLESKGYTSTREDGGLAFADYDGLRFRLVVSDVSVEVNVEPGPAEDGGQARRERPDVFPPLRRRDDGVRDP